MMPIDRIHEIKTMYMSGLIDYDEAKKRAEPIIEEMNKRGAEIAKKHGRKFPGVKLASLMRQ